MTKYWTRFITTLSTDPRANITVLTAYYLLILAGVFTISALGAFTTPSFVYQGF
jgi:hypothetical protein